jgi:hypothetical protein
VGPNATSGAQTLVPEAGGATNPDGIPYPSPPYGHRARYGTTPGNIIQNFKFLGYPNPADQSQGLQVISLADYYDPCHKRYSLLRISVAGVWCVPCNEETDAIVADQAVLTAGKVVIIQALDDGPTMGVGATPTDLTGWITKHKSNFTEMLDPGLANLGTFFVASAIPWNGDIDPRTMEILQSATGWSGDLNSDLQLPIADAMAMPAYPVTASCP